MNFDFTGKTVIVTGGTSGLGYGISRSFVNAGANVIAFYKSNDEKAKKVSKELNANGNFRAIKVDVSDEDAMKEVFKGIARLDYLINCAGISNEDDFIKLSLYNFKVFFILSERFIFGCNTSDLNLSKSLFFKELINP